MKYTLIIDKEKEEEIRIICHENRPVFDKIEKLIKGEDLELTGAWNDDIVIIDFDKVACFMSNDNNVYALINDRKYKIKKRLYQIEEMLDLNFIKINQSCIANIKQIERFKASFNGFIEVIFKNGYKDIISRRELKNVKERIGM